MRRSGKGWEAEREKIDGEKDGNGQDAGEVEKSPVSLKKYSYEYDTSKMWCPTDISDPFTPGLVFEVNYLMFLFTLICNIIAKDEKHINNY